MPNLTSIGQRERERRQIDEWQRQDRMEMGWSMVGLRDGFLYIGFGLWFERDGGEEVENGREEDMRKKREKRGSKGELTGA